MVQLMLNDRNKIQEDNVTEYCNNFFLKVESWEKPATDGTWSVKISQCQNLRWEYSNKEKSESGSPEAGVSCYNHDR